ncbi:Tryptophan 7-halogenase [Altererythrobacter insulae]|nr:Tryptophan 7-halogenase [Altererythrobacter insulae]
MSDPRAAPLGKILIVGGGSAGWMAATFLSRILGRIAKIELLESDAIGVVGVGEATIPPIRKFNNFCGVDEAAFLRDTQGTFKVGIQFENWGKVGDRYLHAFGRVGQELDALVRMHHWWRLGRQAAGPDYPAWEELFLGRAATDLDRFGFDPRNAGRLSELLPHAYHFDAIAYGQHLRKIAEAQGVKRIEGIAVDAERCSETGNVDAVKLNDGRRLDADLFIDCSGFRSILLGKVMEEPFEDWSHWLPADRAVAVQSQSRRSAIAPATRAIAHTVGWQWRIPLQHRVGNGHVYSSAFSSDDQAEARLRGQLGGEVIGEPRILRFATGRRQRSWVGNVVGLGLSAGFLEPLESTSIHLVQSGLERLAELLPGQEISPALRDRYNAQCSTEWGQIRDFIIAHYKLNQRDDSEFWRHCAEMDVPDTLAENLTLWEEHGELTINGGHLFQVGSWAAVLIGQNCLPAHVHTLTARVAASEIAPHINKLALSLRKQAETLPDHSAFLKRIGANSPS